MLINRQLFSYTRIASRSRIIKKNPSFNMPTSTITPTTFSLLQIYDTAIKCMKKDDFFQIPEFADQTAAFDKKNSNTFFDPFAYPQLTITQLAPDDDDDNDNEDSSQDVPPKEQENQKEQEQKFGVAWSFPIVLFPGEKTGLPVAPGPHTVSVIINLPSGRQEMSSYQDDHREHCEDATVASSWHVYQQATSKIIDAVVEALPSSNYLSFNVKDLEHGNDKLTISIEDEEASKFSVGVHGEHTDGHGTYDAKEKKWSDLRHRHMAPMPFRDKSKTLYKGANEIEKLKSK